ncbi:hypothetical protein [Microbulbifer sp. THAF38]|uniref:hypothetical protein n=1 Tax=Microbulbifer sp. THAF38 TaxID=2587856 RepID=UPI0012683DCB|nr:hypothetical protein [Microbulbifer sp. THAF38]QFT55188.1 hypothetical protein FIU95_11530 [Microbulbifer sp. THAF38]
MTALSDQTRFIKDGVVQRTAARVATHVAVVVAVVVVIAGITGFGYRMGAWTIVFIATNARFIGDITSIIIANLLGSRLAAGLIEAGIAQAIEAVVLKIFL